MTITRLVHSVGSGLVMALLVTSCTTTGTGAAPPPAASDAPPTPTATETVGPECRPAAGRTVTQLPDLVVPPVVVAEIRSPGVEIDGVSVPGSVVEGFAVPGMLVDAGCVIEHGAPGGCLGAVEITGATIPAATIPRSVVARVDLPDGSSVGERVFAAVTVPAVSAAPVRVEQVCQVETGGGLPTVSRPGPVREALSRPGVARPGGSRPGRCVGGGCIPEVVVGTVRLDAVRLPDVDVDPGRLERRVLPDSRAVGVITGERGTSYVAPGDVLFDFDQATLRPDAEQVMAAIAAQVAGSAGVVVVEGHTDDVGDAAHNAALSRRRAQTVTDRLASGGTIAADRITVRGLGESTPAYPNDSDANRGLNRRVVVTVLGP